ncbi:MAG: flippase [Candidatus Dormibacteria bacterium]
MSLAARTGRNTALVAATRLVSRVMVLFVFFLQGRSMGPSNFGRFGLLVVFSALTSVFIDLGLRPLFIRDVAQERGRLSPYLNSILSLKLVLTPLAALILFAAIQLQLPGTVAYTLAPTVCVLVGASLSNQMRAIFFAVGELRYEAMATVVESLVLLGGTVAVAVWHLPWWYFLWAYVASYAFVIVYAGVLGVTRFGHRFAFDLNLRRILGLARESLPFALSFIISTLYYKIDQPILKGITRSDAAVGLYNGAYKFLDAATFIPQALMDPIYPSLSILAADSPERLQGAAVKAYKLLAVIGVPVTVGILVLAQPIIHLGLGAGYDRAVPVLRVLALSVLFLFVNNTFIYTLNAMGHQSESTRLAVLSLVVNVGLNVVLIPQRSSLYGGAMGAAWATALTEMGLFIGGFYLLRKRLFALPYLSSLKGVIPAGVLCAVAMFGVDAGLGGGLPAHLGAVLAGAVVYPAGLLLAHAFTADELRLGTETARSFLRRPRP